MLRYTVSPHDQVLWPFRLSSHKVLTGPTAPNYVIVIVLYGELTELFRHAKIDLRPAFSAVNVRLTTKILLMCRSCRPGDVV